MYDTWDGNREWLDEWFVCLVALIDFNVFP